jgi:hypothetical protein
MFIKRNLKSNEIGHTYNQGINIWILVDYLIPLVSHIVMFYISMYWLPSHIVFSGAHSQIRLWLHISDALYDIVKILNFLYSFCQLCQMAA